MAKQSNDITGIQPFFALVNDVSALLVGARSAEIDVALDDCLERLGQYFDVHQVALGQISKSGELLPSLRMWGDAPAVRWERTRQPA